MWREQGAIINGPDFFPGDEYRALDIIVNLQVPGYGGGFVRRLDDHS